MTETQVVKYDVTDAAIAEMKKMYMGLVITDLDDAEQYDTVHKAHMTVRGKRIEVDKKRKELKADALEWSRKVQDEANRIFALIEPIESHLKAEKQKVRDEKDRIEKERVDAIKDEINSWTKAYQEMKGMGTVEELTEYISKLEAIRGLISPELYFEFTGDAIETANDLMTRAKQDLGNRIRLDKEEAERKAEAERLAAERAELEAKRKEQEERDRVERERQEAEAAKLKADQDRIEAWMKEQNEQIENEKRKLIEESAKLERAKLEKLRKEQEERDREEFERQAKIKAEAEAKAAAEREASEKAEREKLRKEEAIRQEALRPDKEKLAAFAQFLMEGMTYPNVKSAEASELIQWAYGEIAEISETILEKSEKL